MTYGRLVCDIKEHNSETHRTQLTVGGNLLDLPGLLSTPTATVTTAKCLFKIFISTPGAKCLVADIKNFYLKNVHSVTHPITGQAQEYRHLMKGNEKEI